MYKRQGYVYNPATLHQREDRLHRYGQTKVVNVFRHYYNGSIDVGIRNIVFDRIEEQEDFNQGIKASSISRSSIARMVYGR